MDFRTLLLVLFLFAIFLGLLRWALRKRNDQIFFMGLVPVVKGGDAQRLKTG